MRQPPAWQRALRDAITAPADLLAAVGLGPSCCRSASTTLSSPGVLASRSRGSSSCIRITRTRSTRRCAPHCDALVDLSEALVAAGVLPYYRHLLDPVAGAAHFAVPESEARALAAGIAASLPGYLAPRLVREVPGPPPRRCCHLHHVSGRNAGAIVTADLQQRGAGPCRGLRE